MRGFVFQKSCLQARSFLLAVPQVYVSYLSLSFAIMASSYCYSLVSDSGEVMECSSSIGKQALGWYGTMRL